MKKICSYLAIPISIEPFEENPDFPITKNDIGLILAAGTCKLTIHMSERLKPGELTISFFAISDPLLYNIVTTTGSVFQKNKSDFQFVSPQAIYRFVIIDSLENEKTILN